MIYLCYLCYNLIRVQVKGNWLLQNSTKTIFVGIEVVTYNVYDMAADRPQFRIDTSAAVKNRAKAAAYSRGLSLNEFVLQALAKAGDKELAKLIEKDLSARQQRGRPQK